jgi:hypothetical protein
LIGPIPSAVITGAVTTQYRENGTTAEVGLLIRSAGFGQSFSPRDASDRELRSCVTKLELPHIVRHLDDAPAERLGAALRPLHEK